MISCLLILYRVMIDFSYIEVSRMYDYQRLFANNNSTASILLSWLLFFCFVPLLVRLFDGKKLSNYILILLSLFSLIPQTSVIAHRSDYNIIFIILVMFYWFLILILHLIIAPIKFSFSPGRFSERFPYIILNIMIATVVIYSYLTTGLRLHFDLIDVYTIREEARGFGMIFPFNYIISFADNALAFFAVLFLHQRRYIFFGLVVVVIFINFSISGSKQIALILVCGLSGYYFIRSHKHLNRLLMAVVILLVLCFIEVILFDTRWLTFLYPYRVLFLPAEFHNSYYNFFQFNELDLYRQSILKIFFMSNYTINLQFLLGEYTIGDITARANNGLFSDAYMNLGYVGILIYPLLIVILLRLFDGVAIRIDTRIWPVLAIYIAFVLLGMTLSSALLTSGLLPLLLMLYTFPRSYRVTFNS